MAITGVLIAKILGIVFGVNVVLSSLKAGLDQLVKSSTNPTLLTVDTFLGKIASVLGKVLDVIGYNPEHK